MHAHQLKSMRFGARARGLRPGATRAALRTERHFRDAFFISSEHIPALCAGLPSGIRENRANPEHRTLSSRVPSGPGLVYRPRGPRLPHHATSATAALPRQDPSASGLRGGAAAAGSPSAHPPRRERPVRRKGRAGRGGTG